MSNLEKLSQYGAPDWRVAPGYGAKTVVGCHVCVDGHLLGLGLSTEETAPHGETRERLAGRLIEMIIEHQQQTRPV